jgi:hypothetical protein
VRKKKRTLSEDVMNDTDKSTAVDREHTISSSLLYTQHFLDFLDKQLERPHEPSNSDFRNIIEFLYSVQEPEKVQSFLEANKFLVPLLLTAYVHIQEHFPGSVVRLEMDAEDNSQLIASIITNRSPDEAFQQLEQFDEQWWLDALDKAEMKLTISLEFE